MSAINESLIAESGSFSLTDINESETKNPLLVRIYSPSGNCFEVLARDAEHAAWLQKVNPKYSQSRIGEAEALAASFEEELKNEVAA